MLFLDEAPEFDRGVIDSLRQCLESGSITIRRVGASATYPARFSLVMAANPCPCAKSENQCTCTPDRRRGYLSKLSGPVMDRMDITVRLPAILRADMVAERGQGDSTAALAARVLEARERAERRFGGTPWRTNADVPGVIGSQRWPIPRADLAVAGRYLDRGQLTARGYHRVQRLAWTVADLAGRAVPNGDDVEQALSLRLGDVVTGRRVA